MKPETCSDTPFGQSVRGAGSFPSDPASSGNLLDLLREARAYVPSLTALAHAIDDVLPPSCIFCQSTTHWSMDCRAHAITEQGRTACR